MHFGSSLVEAMEAFSDVSILNCFALSALLYLIYFICFALSAMLYVHCFMCNAVCALLYAYCMYALLKVLKRF